MTPFRPAPIFIALGCAVVIGLWLLRAGRRGVLLDYHPRCRRCGFDLSGSPRGAAVCGECGADVTKPKAIRRGTPRRRPALIWPGALIIVGCLGVGGFLGYDRLHSVGWLRHAPTWYVLVEAKSSNQAVLELIDRSRENRLTSSQQSTVLKMATDAMNKPTPWPADWATLAADADAHGATTAWPAYVAAVTARAVDASPLRRSPAINHLGSLYCSNAIDPATLQSIIVAGLAYQGDVSRSWSPEWGDLIQLAHADGRLTDGQWRQYARQAWTGSLTITCRTKVTTGGGLALKERDGPGRAGKHSALSTRYSSVVEYIEPGRLAYIHTQLQDQSLSTYLSGYDTWRLPLPRSLSPGQASYHVEGDLSIYNEEAKGHTEVVVTDHFNLAADFEVLPSDRPSVTMIHKPESTDHVRSCIQWQSALLPDSPNFSYDEATTLWLRRPPVPLSFKVIATDVTGQPVELGTIACQAGQVSEHHFDLGRHHEHQYGPTTTITLRGDPAAAADTLDQFEAWDGTIVLKDVPVVRPKP